MQKILILAVLSLLSLGIGKGMHTLKDGFSYRRIQSVPIWTHEEFEKGAESALDQTYHYLGRGRQCFAFESEDQKYVLKFPRTDLYKMAIWEKYLLPKKSREKIETKRNRKKEFILKSFEIAYRELKEETAMVALHIGEGNFKKKMTLVDKMGYSHRVPLEKVSFALQYKRPTFLKEFQKASLAKDIEKEKKLINLLVSTIHTRAKKQILNKDRSFLKNFGYDGEKIYQIDVGSFYYDPKLNNHQATRKSMMDSIDPIKEWLLTVDPEMATYLNSLIPNL